MEERTEDKALTTCSVYTTMASRQEAVGVAAGQRVAVCHCSVRMPLLGTDKRSPLEASWAMAHQVILSLREGRPQTNAQKLSKHHKGQILPDPGRCLLYESLWCNDLKTRQ